MTELNTKSLSDCKQEKKADIYCMCNISGTYKMFRFVCDQEECVSRIFFSSFVCVCVAVQFHRLSLQIQNAIHNSGEMYNSIIRSIFSLARVVRSWICFHTL